MLVDDPVSQSTPKKGALFFIFLLAFLPLIYYLCGVINNNTMSEEKKILKGTVADVRDRNYRDQNGNMYFDIAFKETPTVVGTIAIREGGSLKVGDEIFYSSELRRDKNNKEYLRYRREKDPSAPEYSGGAKRSAYEREDPYVKVIAMCLSYANELAVHGQIDPSKVLTVAGDYTSWVWGKIDERKR